MSELTTAARPYAKAVFELAESSGTLDSWSEQLGAMASLDFIMPGQSRLRMICVLNQSWQHTDLCAECIQEANEKKEKVDKVIRLFVLHKLFQYTWPTSWYTACDETAPVLTERI